MPLVALSGPDVLSSGPSRPTGLTRARGSVIQSFSLSLSLAGRGEGGASEDRAVDGLAATSAAEDAADPRAPLHGHGRHPLGVDGEVQVWAIEP